MNETNITPIMRAARNNDIEGIKSLIEGGAVVDDNVVMDYVFNNHQLNDEVFNFLKDKCINLSSIV